MVNTRLTSARLMRLSLRIVSVEMMVNSESICIFDGVLRMCNKHFRSNYWTLWNAAHKNDWPWCSDDDDKWRQSDEYDLNQSSVTSWTRKRWRMSNTKPVSTMSNVTLRFRGRSTNTYKHHSYVQCHCELWLWTYLCHVIVCKLIAAQMTDWLN